MKKIPALFGILFTVTASFSQDLKNFKLYKPEENAEEKIAEAARQANAEGKHVFIQIGGNWCIWCARFNEFTSNDPSIDSLIKSSYVVYHLNYSKENRNEKLMAKYDFPQRFGFPVFLVLDRNGKLIHTQNSSYLEEGKSYDQKTVLGFLGDWTVDALDPNKYKNN